MSTLNKALVTGATGLCGSHCVSLLLEDNTYASVEIWVRKPTGMIHSKLIEKIVDYENPISLPPIDAQHVFCCLGTTIKKAGSKISFFKTDHDIVIEIAKNAAANGVEKFMYISSIGANARSGNFYLNTKGKTEEDLKSAGLKSLIILRPSMLMGKRNEFRLGEIIGKGIMTVVGFLLVGKWRKYRGIEAKQVVESMIFFAKSNHQGHCIIESDNISNPST